MGTKKLMVSPIEERAHGDPVALFFGVDSDMGVASTFEIDAESDDLWSIWLVQYSVSNDTDLLNLDIYVPSTYAQSVPFGSTNPANLYIVSKAFALTELHDADSFIKPRFCGWKKPNTKYQIIVDSQPGAEEATSIYIRGLIYKEFPVMQ